MSTTARPFTPFGIFLRREDADSAIKDLNKAGKPEGKKFKRVKGTHNGFMEWQGKKRVEVPAGPCFSILRLS